MALKDSRRRHLTRLTAQITLKLVVESGGNAVPYRLVMADPILAAGQSPLFLCNVWSRLLRGNEPAGRSLLFSRGWGVGWCAFNEP